MFPEKHAPDKTARPMIGQACRYQGRLAEVRASYPSPRGVCVVAVYREPVPLRGGEGDGRLVALWSECEPAQLAA